MDEVKDLLNTMSEAELRQVGAFVRDLLPKHPVEEALLVSYDEILYALGRAGDFTVRMIRGVFAEAAFAADVLPNLRPRWKDIRPPGSDPPYDFLLEETFDPEEGAAPAFPQVRVQVKMQRSEGKVPLQANRVWRSRVAWPATHFVVEVQKSRKGEKQGRNTRPYRFGEFDILAVSLGPSTGRWADFVYTLERWLLPDPASPECLLIYQPVSPVPNGSWTDDFDTAVAWLRGGVDKRIDGDLPTLKAPRRPRRRQ